MPYSSPKGFSVGPLLRPLRSAESIYQRVTKNVHDRRWRTRTRLQGREKMSPSAMP